MMPNFWIKYDETNHVWLVIQDGLCLTTAFANEDAALQYIEELKAYDRWADGPWGLRQQQRDL